MGAPVRLNQHAVHMVRGDLLGSLATSRNQAAKAQDFSTAAGCREPPV